MKTRLVNPVCTLVLNEKFDVPDKSYLAMSGYYNKKEHSLTGPINKLIQLLVKYTRRYKGTIISIYVENNLVKNPEFTMSFVSADRFSILTPTYLYANKNTYTNNCTFSNYYTMCRSIRPTNEKPFDIIIEAAAKDNEPKRRMIEPTTTGLNQFQLLFGYMYGDIKEIVVNEVAFKTDTMIIKGDESDWFNCSVTFYDYGYESEVTFECKDIIDILQNIKLNKNNGGRK